MNRRKGLSRAALSILIACALGCGSNTTTKNPGGGGGTAPQESLLDDLLVQYVDADGLGDECDPEGGSTLCTLQNPFLCCSAALPGGAPLTLSGILGLVLLVSIPGLWTILLRGRLKAMAKSSARG